MLSAAITYQVLSQENPKTIEKVKAVLEKHPWYANEWRRGFKTFPSLIMASCCFYMRQGGLTMFASRTGKGQLIDLKQRWLSFEAVFSGVGAKLSNRAELQRIARDTLADQALKLANYAYARGFRNFPVAEAEALAYEIDPNIRNRRTGRAFYRRKRMGMAPLPLHPFWAASAIDENLPGAARLHNGGTGW